MSSHNEFFADDLDGLNFEFANESFKFSHDDLQQVLNDWETTAPDGVNVNADQARSSTPQIDSLTYLQGLDQNSLPFTQDLNGQDLLFNPAFPITSFTAAGSVTPSHQTTQPPPKIGARFSREALQILRTWLSSHSSHPFPSDEEKEILQRQTGLTKTQILNWLANARRRGKVPTPLPASPQLPNDSSVPLSIPPRRPTPSPYETSRPINPLERWVDSPPESEPATATAIARAVASSSRKGSRKTLTLTTPSYASFSPCTDTKHV